MHIRAMTVAIALGMTALAYGETPAGDLQAQVDACRIGKTDKDALVAAFGEPKELVKGATLKASRKVRTLYAARYPQLGLAFTLMSDPWELYDITVENPSVSFDGVHVGMTENEVRKQLGKKVDWGDTTQDAPTWKLEHKGKDTYFEFERDLTAPQFPMKLKEPAKVVRIGRYNGRVIFTAAPRQ